LSREYSIDPLEILFVREVMRTNVIALPHNLSIEGLSSKINVSHGQHLYPLINGSNALEGVVTRKDLARVQLGTVAFSEVVRRKVVTAYPDEPLRLVVYRMAETGLTRMPVVDRDNPSKLLGMVSLTDLLRARTRDHEEEHRRERVLRLRIPFASTQGSKRVTRAATD
jgi:chloride channel protein, CIC family